MGWCPANHHNAHTTLQILGKLSGHIIVFWRENGIKIPPCFAKSWSSVDIFWSRYKGSQPWFSYICGGKSFEETYLAISSEAFDFLQGTVAATLLCTVCVTLPCNHCDAFPCHSRLTPALQGLGGVSKKKFGGHVQHYSPV